MAKDNLKFKENRKKKKLEVKKSSFYWFYFIIGGLVILLSLFFAPFWNEISKEIPWASWYSYALGGLVAAAIITYMFTILLAKLKNKEINKIVKIIFAIEFSLMAFFAICCIVKAILNDNEKFAFLNACEIIGVALWVRGVVEMINAYYYDKNSKQKYPIWYLLFNILLISVGPIILSVGIIYKSKVDVIVSYAFCSVIFVLGVLCCVWGGLCKPIKIKEIPVEIVDENIKIENTVKELETENDKIENQEVKTSNNDVILISQEDVSPEVNSEEETSESNDNDDDVNNNSDENLDEENNTKEE